MRGEPAGGYTPACNSGEARGHRSTWEQDQERWLCPVSLAPSPSRMQGSRRTAHTWAQGPALRGPRLRPGLQAEEMSKQGTLVAREGPRTQAPLSGPAGWCGPCGLHAPDGGRCWLQSPSGLGVSGGGGQSQGLAGDPGDSVGRFLGGEPWPQTIALTKPNKEFASLFLLFAFLVPKKTPFLSGEAHYLRGYGQKTLALRPKPEQRKLLDQLLPPQGIRYKTQGLFFEEAKKRPASHIPLGETPSSFGRTWSLRCPCVQDGAPRAMGLRSGQKGVGRHASPSMSSALVSDCLLAWLGKRDDFQ